MLSPDPAPLDETPEDAALYGDSQRDEQTRRGPRLADVSRVIVQLHRKYYGKGPTRAKSYIVDDMVVCVLGDIFTPVEKTLIEVGRSDWVRQTRHVFQDAMEIKFRHAIEEITGRRVDAFLSLVHIGPDLAVEMFFLAPEDEEE